MNEEVDRADILLRSSDCAALIDSASILAGAEGVRDTLEAAEFA